MAGQYLRLSSLERRYNDYYTNELGLRGVLSRRHTFRTQLEGGVLQRSDSFNAVRYSRVWAITFSGDVTALKLFLQLGTGGAITAAPVHLPLLSGASSWSPLLDHPVLYNPAYPSTGLIPDNYVPQVQEPQNWVIDPNIIVPNAQALLFNFSLEDEDAGIPEGGFFAVEVCVHHFQFPDFEGGP